MLGLGNSLVGGIVLGWTPAELSSLSQWYRFNTGQTIDGEGDVTEWADQKGSNDLTAAGGTNVSPTGTAGAVVFDSSGDIMTFDSATSLGKFSIYFRAKFDGFNAENCIETGSSDFIQIKSATEIRVKVDNGGAEGGRHDYTAPATISTDTKFNLGWERDGDGTMLIYLNGAAGAHDATGAGDGTQPIAELLALSRLGKPTETSSWYEVVICNDVLSSSDRALLQTYLDSI